MKYKEIEDTSFTVFPVLRFSFRKHQLFEKNLLDQYVANHHKQKTIHSIMLQEEDDEESIEEEERTVPEDWGDDVEEDEEASFPSSHTESLLPSQASWGTRDKHIEKAASPQPSSVPKEQGIRTDLKTRKSESPVQNVKADEYPEITATSKVTSPSIPIPNMTVSSGKKNNNNNISPATSKIDDSYSSNNSIPEENLKAFSTGS